MSRKKRAYEDDDGRTIADMTGVSGPSLFVPRSSGRKEFQEPEKKSQRPWEDTGYSRKERFMLVMGAMKATMLIALAYILGIGLLILIMCILI